MFGKSKLKVYGIINEIRKFFRKAHVSGSIEVKDNHCDVTLEEVTLEDQNCQFVSILISESGFIIMSAKIGHLTNSYENLELINAYNCESCYWRAYIDEDEDLCFGYESEITSIKEIEPFLKSYFNSITSDENKDVFTTLCSRCI